MVELCWLPSLCLSLMPDTTIPYFFLAHCQIIYANLRHDIFGRLYRWDVKQRRIEPILERLDALLGDVISEVGSSELALFCLLQLVSDVDVEERDIFLVDVVSDVALAAVV